MSSDHKKKRKVGSAAMSEGSLERRKMKPDREDWERFALFYLFPLQLLELYFVCKE